MMVVRHFSLVFSKTFNFLAENDEVLVAGLGRKGHAVGDIPGVRFKIIAVKGISLLALYTKKKDKL